MLEFLWSEKKINIPFKSLHGSIGSNPVPISSFDPSPALIVSAHLNRNKLFQLFPLALQRGKFLSGLKLINHDWHCGTVFLGSPFFLPHFQALSFWRFGIPVLISNPFFLLCPEEDKKKQIFVQHWNTGQTWSTEYYMSRSKLGHFCLAFH